MGKAFLTHFIAAVIYWSMVFYVMQEEETNTGSRFFICFLFLLSQLIAVAICDTNKYYSTDKTFKP